MTRPRPDRALAGGADRADRRRRRTPRRTPTSRSGRTSRCGDDVLRRPAFWDGGDRWRVRFAAPYAGDWDWADGATSTTPGSPVGRARSPASTGRRPGRDARTSTASGGCRPAGRQPRPRRRHARADGRRHGLGAALAGHPRAGRGLRPRPAGQGLQRRAADDGAAGHARASGRATAPPTRGSTSASRTCPRAVCSELDPDYFGRLDALLDILLAHDLVPVLQPVFQGFGWKGLDVAGKVVPPEEYARYCRYLVARYGARPAIYLVGADGTGEEPQVAAGGAEVARVGRLRPADRHPLPAARDQPRPPGCRLAGLPEVPDGSRRRAHPGPGGGHVAQHPGQGRAERGADVRAHPRARTRRRLVAGPRGLEQPVLRRRPWGSATARRACGSGGCTPTSPATASTSWARTPAGGRRWTSRARPTSARSARIMRRPALPRHGTRLDQPRSGADCSACRESSCCSTARAAASST